MEDQRIKIGEQIAEEVSRRIKAKAMVTTVQKSNRKRIGLTIHFQDHTFCPIIYLEPYFSSLEMGIMDIKSVAEDIIAILENQNMPDIPNVSNIFEKNYILEHACYSLVNKEKNQSLLNDYPHCQILDLVALFRCYLNDETSFLISNKNMKKLNISIQELMQAAHKNTIEQFGCVIRNLSDVIQEITGTETPEMKGNGVLLITNKTYFQGASLFLYSDVFKEISVKLGTEEFFILPSSRHELLVLEADNNVTVGELKSMVKQVNRTTVSEEDFLSDSIYKWENNGLIQM